MFKERHQNDWFLGEGNLQHATIRLRYFLMPGGKAQRVTLTVSQDTFSHQNATPFAGKAGTCIDNTNKCRYCPEQSAPVAP